MSINVANCGLLHSLYTREVMVVQLNVQIKPVFTDSVTFRENIG